MKPNKHVKLGELEIPVDYFKMSKEDKEVLCNVIMDSMLTVLDRELKSDIDRIEIFNKSLCEVSRISFYISHVSNKD